MPANFEEFESCHDMIGAALLATRPVVSGLLEADGALRGGEVQDLNSKPELRSNSRLVFVFTS